MTTVVINKEDIARASAAFDQTATGVHDLMGKMKGAVNDLLSKPNSFVGATRVTFDQHLQRISTVIDQSVADLNAISTSFRDVQNKHTGMAEQKAMDLNRIATTPNGGSGVDISGGLGH